MKKRILKKRQKGKIPKMKWNIQCGGYDYFCPTCNGILDTGVYLEYRQFCSRCGQKLFWSDEDEST